MSNEFKREDRYIVIKRSDLKKVPVGYRSHLVDPMFSLLSHLPRRECLVIESDWPEYEFAWESIEARMTGSTPKGMVSKARVFDYERGFSAGDAERQTLQAENRRLRQFETALSEWADKTEWLRITIQPKELGMHLADVMKGRIDQLTVTNELLRDRKNSIVMLKSERDQLEALLFRVIDSSVLAFEQDGPEELQSLEADICAALSKPAGSEPDVEPPEATGDCHDDDLGDGEAERMQRKAKNESTAYDEFDNGVD
ncbi:Uncharacterized protein AC504_2431 [Pseudomonas syringae pv. maculicola]|uniref:hypothetical protein n=1 Tax=Pseudomonas savastanoi TaxID=29438 RepID=UPI0006B92FA3|nr:hypothetical protein [Pseudomonas savastanoi]KPB87065.1 Uncharacterized protein AC504_2431 [Pseudomonas syringae pv. maculicola]MBN4175029.1 hypothetical protein [Pseudomonas savastanoi pv. phaseolicola]RMR86243.1 hypothetical protein ALP76_01804 [Pseudomonas savastanoi pv. glycinea]